MDFNLEWGVRQVRIIGNSCSCICTFYWNGKANVMLVDNVFVDENYRNKGLGTKLMEFVLELAKAEGVDSVELVVNSDNESAKRVYEKVGFEPTQKIHYRKILNKWKT